jgi:tetratricopeptide (TPR) repeat protein
MHGLARCYQNYIEAVSNPVLKTQLSEEESKALQTALSKMLAPINEKYKDISRKISALKVESTESENKNKIAVVSFTETIKPPSNFTSATHFSLYIPQMLSPAASEKWQAFPASRKDKCIVDLSKDLNSLAKDASQCISVKSYANAQKIAEQISRLEPKNPAGTFYMALVASETKQHKKALWLYDLSLKKQENPVTRYNKAREFLAYDQVAAAQSELGKAIDDRFDSSELQMIKAMQSYAQGDCLSALDVFNNMDTKEIRSLHLSAVVAECTNAKGEPDDAIQLLKKDLSENKKQPELWLELARLQEVFKFEKNEAVAAYQNASQFTSDTELKSWVQGKIDYLNGNPTVTILKPQHVPPSITGTSASSKDRQAGTVGGPE